MSNKGETTDPTRTGNVGPSFIQGTQTGTNFTPGPMEGDATSGATGSAGADGAEDTRNDAGVARQSGRGAPDQAIGNAGQPLDPNTARAGGQGAAGLAGAASRGDVVHPGMAAPADLSGAAGVDNPTGTGGPGAGGAMGAGGPTDVTTLGEQRAPPGQRPLMRRAASPLAALRQNDLQRRVGAAEVVEVLNP